MAYAHTISNRVYRFADLTTLLAKATPGPWGAFPYFHEYVVPADHMHRSIGGSIDPVRDNADYANVIATIGGCDRQFPNRRGRSFEEADANRDLIVALRNAAPALVAELRAARREVDRLRAELFADDPARPWRLATFVLLKRLGGDVTTTMDEWDAAREGTMVTNDPLNPGRIYLTLSRAATGGKS